MTEAFGARVDQALASIRKHSDARPSVAVVLGSGLSDVVDQFGGVTVPYGQIAGFPAPTVVGHRGSLSISDSVVLFAGRFHFYEGHDMDTVVLPVALAHKLGARTIVLTNAAGSLNRGLRPGTIALIRDHIGLFSRNPLIGPNDDNLGQRFVDQSDVWTAALRSLAQGVAREQSGLDLPEAVYCCLSGPSYETPAEIGVLSRIGADLVGMSTVPEAIVARWLGMQCLGFSTVTNLAAGVSEHPLSHEEVVETGRQVRDRLGALLTAVISRIAG